MIGDTFTSGEPLSMTVGETGVPGWDQGVAGACQGERRSILIPPKLGYGEKGIEGVVPPNALILIELEVIVMRFKCYNGIKTIRFVSGGYLLSV